MTYKVRVFIITNIMHTAKRKLKTNYTNKIVRTHYFIGSRAVLGANIASQSHGYYFLYWSKITLLSQNI